VRVNQKIDAIASNLFHVRSTIAEAAHACTRSSDAIRLIAVSKGHPPEAIAAAVAAGQKIFGESTTQEALPKISYLKKFSLEWHFIGHLQKNKTKFLPHNFFWLHSLDNLQLAQKISRFAHDESVRINILIEVNVAGDPKKHGLLPTDLPKFLETFLTMNVDALSLKGLTTIAPQTSSEKELRSCFASLRNLQEQCQLRFGLKDFTELSMGMSGDYVEAIKEGATLLRIGSAIFGDRDYLK